MAVKPGYKQSEVGIIPEDWIVRNVGDISEVKTGPFGSTLHEKDYVVDGTPIITVEHLGEQGVIHKNLPMVSDYDKNRLKVYSLQKNDIVFSRVGSVDRNALIKLKEEGWLFSGRLLRVRLKSENIDPSYLSYHFHSEDFKQRVRDVAVGQTMASLNTKILLGVKTVLPPTLAEQHAIATALSDVDALITSLDQLIAKKCLVKQGAMQELLTGKKRLPGFVGEWELKTFGELVAVRNQKIDPRRENRQFCVELEHISQGGGRLIGSTETNETSSIKSVFCEGDVLFGKLRAYLRKYWLADRDGVCTTEIWPLVSRQGIFYGPYLLQIVQMDGFIDIATMSYGTHMPRTDWNLVKNFKVLTPSLPEQRAIAEVLSDMDTEIIVLEERLAKIRILKQGMMQELLAGRIRLV